MDSKELMILRHLSVILTKRILAMEANDPPISLAQAYAWLVYARKQVNDTLG